MTDRQLKWILWTALACAYMLSVPGFYKVYMGVSNEISTIVRRHQAKKAELALQAQKAQQEYEESLARAENFKYEYPGMYKFHKNLREKEAQKLEAKYGPGAYRQGNVVMIPPNEQTGFRVLNQAGRFTITTPENSEKPSPSPTLQRIRKIIADKNS